MKLNSIFLILSASLGVYCGFFSNIMGGSSQSVAPDDEALQNAAEMASGSIVRGLPDNIAQNLLNSPTFQCDQGKRNLPISNLNDGFCDCADGFDEPGTSACIKSTFHCVNIGYKTTKLPSSRVDDGICDCCDGSDEGNIFTCPNTCRFLYI